MWISNNDKVYEAKSEDFETNGQNEASRGLWTQYTEELDYSWMLLMIEVSMRKLKPP